MGLSTLYVFQRFDYRLKVGVCENEAKHGDGATEKFSSVLYLIAVNIIPEREGERGGDMC